MLKKLGLCALLMTACIGSLVANDGSPHRRWSIGADYLYLKPSVDDTYFVIDSPILTDFPNGTRENNDFNFHSGYRINAAYEFCDCNRALQVSYSHLGFSQSRTVAGNFLWATVGRADTVSSFEHYAGTATSNLDYLYQRLDVLYAQQVFDCCKLDVAVQFGLEFAELKLNEDVAYVNNVGPVTNTTAMHSKVSGVGPQVGLALGYQLYERCGCACPGLLSFNVVTSGSLLAAKSKASEFDTAAGVTITDVSDSSTWRVIPALHLRAGFSYDMCFSCLDASIEIGYEFNSYLRGLSRLSFADDVADGRCDSLYYDFDLQGLYVGVNVSF